MKFLIVFVSALAAVSAGYIAPVAPVVYGAQHLPVIGANGVPIDTPEVQHARAAHYAHKVEAHARNGDYAVVSPIVAAHGYVAQPAVYATSVVQPTTVNGVPLETPEVVAAKSNHFAAHAEALARTGHVTAVHHLRRRRGLIGAAPLAYAGYPGYTGYAGYASPYYGVSTYAAGSPVIATSYAAHPVAYSTPYAHYF